VDRPEGAGQHSEPLTLHRCGRAPVDPTPARSSSGYRTCTREARERYLLLLYDDAAAIAELSPSDRRALVDEHIAYSRTLRERGMLVHGDPLDDPATARTIRFETAGGDPLVSDGPFLEAKEALGGFYVIDVASPDEALQLAEQVPRSPGLVAELRPIPEV
jgi:hypothetical protein